MGDRLGTPGAVFFFSFLSFIFLFLAFQFLVIYFQLLASTLSSSLCYINQTSLCECQVLIRGVTGVYYLVQFAPGTQVPGYATTTLMNILFLSLFIILSVTSTRHHFVNVWMWSGA